MKTGHTRNCRSVFPKDYCKKPPVLLQSKLNTLSSFLQQHELLRHSWFPHFGQILLFAIVQYVGFPRQPSERRGSVLRTSSRASYGCCSPFSALDLVLGVVRVHCMWEADLDLCHPPQTTCSAPIRMAHAMQPESHTSAPAPATPVNHLCWNPRFKASVDPCHFCDFNRFGETRGLSLWDMQSKQSNKKLWNAVLIVSQPLKKSRNAMREGWFQSPVPLPLASTVLPRSWSDILDTGSAQSSGDHSQNKSFKAVLLSTGHPGTRYCITQTSQARQQSKVGAL